MKNFEQISGFASNLIVLVRYVWRPQVKLSKLNGKIFLKILTTTVFRRYTEKAKAQNN